MISIICKNIFYRFPGSFSAKEIWSRRLDEYHVGTYSDNVL